MDKAVFFQRILEKRTSMNALDDLIRKEIDETDITVFLDLWHKYIDDINNLDSKHKEFHAMLLKDINPEKAIRTSIRALVKTSVTTNSYIDRNVVANTIGKKLLRSLNGSPYNKATTALSLGLNVVNALASMNIVKYKMLHKKHNISALVLNKNLVPKSVKEKSLDLRASTFMLTEPVPHGDKPGGYYTMPRTMLNSSGFNTVHVQDAATNIAINKLQAVPYNMRSNYSTELINEYSHKDKWFNAQGQFMSNEWRKFVDDIKLAKDKDIYFPMSYDDRGRMYETSAYIKYQGDSYQKSMLEFANKETVTEEGMNNLKIALVNEIHSDKIAFEDAIAWYDSKTSEELDLIVSDSNDPIAVNLWADIKDAKEGKAIGTITHWDATNSGLQFYSIIGRDKATASLCNVYNTGKIADAYQALADELNSTTVSTRFNRSNVKKAFMTFLYGAMDSQILFKTEDPKNGVTCGIMEFFPDDWDGDKAWKAFTGAMTKIAPAAIKLMNLMYTYNVEGKTKFNWTMPDGFEVETTSVQSYNGLTKGKDPIRGWFMDHKGKTHEGSIAIKLEEHTKYSRALAPNIIHSIDAYFGREVVKRADFDISFIHDSFGCHPNYATKLQAIVREVAAEMIDQDILTDILTQLSSEQTRFNLRKGRLSFGDLTAEDVRNSNYIVR